MYIDSSEFGEGVAPISDKQFLMLTWKARTMHIINRETLQIEKTVPLFRECREGWGITSRKIPNQE